MAKRATIAGVKKAMTALGVYKPEFDGAIARYVEMRKEYVELYGRYTDADFPCAEKKSAPHLNRKSPEGNGRAGDRTGAQSGRADEVEPGGVCRREKAGRVMDGRR